MPDDDKLAEDKRERKRRTNVNGSAPYEIPIRVISAKLRVTRPGCHSFFKGSCQVVQEGSRQASHPLEYSLQIPVLKKPHLQ